MNLYAVAILLEFRNGNQKLAVASITANSEREAKQETANELKRRSDAVRAEVMVKEIPRSQIREAR